MKIMCGLSLNKPNDMLFFLVFAQINYDIFTIIMKTVYKLSNFFLSISIKTVFFIYQYPFASF